MSETSRHDALFRLMFRDRETATGLIRSHLEPELAAQIDWSTLRLAPSEYVDEALDDSRSDLLFEAYIGGRPGFLYLLVEHQSSADAIMPFRVVRYMVQVWDRWLDAHPGALRLPPVLPVVVHHDRTPWSAPTRLSEVIDLPPELTALLASRLPELELSIDELTGITDEALARRSLNVFGDLTVRALTRIRFGGDVMAEVTRWLPLLRVMWREPGGLPRLRAFIQYIGWQSDAPPGELAQVIRRIGPGALEDYMRSTNQQIMDEAEAMGLEKGLQKGLEKGLQKGLEKGLQKGLEKGLQKGLEEGLAEGEAKTLLRLLELRFGSLDDATKDYVHAGSAEDRERWVERVLTAESLGGVFAAD